MPSASGISILGKQTLLNNVTVISKQLSVAITDQQLPPQRRLGYFYLYAFENIAPRQHFLMESGILYAPGIWIPIRIPPFTPSYLYRIDVVWSFASVPWTAVII